MNLNEYGLSELINKLRSREITPLDVANDTVAAYEAQEPALNAYINFFAEELVKKAKALTKSGEYRSTLLWGLPIAVKDNICVRGHLTTAGSRILAGYHSPYNATVVDLLEEAGGLIAGKTNLDEFAMGSSTENSAFGPTRNPCDTECAPGGSSGGSAAAVAAHMAVASLGSDTGGSIRQPASFCGVVGMKPTYGRVSRYGLIAFASSLDQIGTFTKSVRDCALMLTAICGNDPRDATSYTGTVPNFLENLDHGLKDITIGVPRDFLGVGMDQDVSDNFEQTLVRLEKNNVRLVDVSMPHARHAVACYYVIANAEASSNLARFDGVKYGHRSSRSNDVYSMYTRTRDEGFGDEVKRRVLLGTYVLSAGYYDAYYLQAQKVRTLAINDFEAAFEKCDLIALPTAPSTAFRIGEKIGDPLQMYLSDVFTIPVSLAGLPALSMPVGRSSAGLPFGLQLVGKPLAENTVLKGASGLEEIVEFE